MDHPDDFNSFINAATMSTVDFIYAQCQETPVPREEVVKGRMFVAMFSPYHAYMGHLVFAWDEKAGEQRLNAISGPPQYHHMLRPLKGESVADCCEALVRWGIEVEHMPRSIDEDIAYTEATKPATTPSA